MRRKFQSTDCLRLSFQRPHLLPDRRQFFLEQLKEELERDGRFFSSPRRHKVDANIVGL